MAEKSKFGLGRGLGALIPQRHAKDEPTEKEKNYFSSRSFAAHGIDEDVARSSILEVPIEDIHPSEHQARMHFAQKPIEELAKSIKEHGILQPLVAVKRKEGGYTLVAGERRLRASALVNIKTVPVIVREYGELEQLELGLIENIQRTDLNPIEKARAYQQLNDQFGLTHEQIAKRLGVSRPAVSNVLRLLSLPENIQKALAEGAITEGHAKVLMEIGDEKKRESLFKKVIGGRLTISDTSREVKKVSIKPHQRAIHKDPNVAAHEAELREALGTKVLIRRRGKSGGEIVIEYYGEDELSELVKRISS